LNIFYEFIQKSVKQMLALDQQKTIWK